MSYAGPFGKQHDGPGYVPPTGTPEETAANVARVDRERMERDNRVRDRMTVAGTWTEELELEWKAERGL